MGFQIGASWPRKGNTFSRFLGRAIMRLMGWRLSDPPPDLPKLVVIAAPHTSNWDAIIGLAAVLAMGVQISFLGKKTAFFWPVGAILKWFGGIPVDRFSPQGVVEQMVAEFHRRDKFVLAMSPEGTRAKVDAWRTGFYRIAHQAKAPVVCAMIDYGQKKIAFSHAMPTTGDWERDLQEYKAFFANATAKHPELY